MTRTHLDDGVLFRLHDAMRKRRAELRDLTFPEIASVMHKPKEEGGVGCDAITANHVRRVARSLGWIARPPAPVKAALPAGVAKLVASLSSLLMQAGLAMAKIETALDGKAPKAKRPVPGPDVLQSLRAQINEAIDGGLLGRTFHAAHAMKCLRTSGSYIRVLLDHLVAIDELTRHATGRFAAGRPIYTYTRNRRLVEPSVNLSSVSA